MRRLSDQLFLAVAHPVRREILDLLAEAGLMPVSELQVRTQVSASALSQHLRILKDTALVRDERQGRSIYYQLTPEPLLEVIEWMLRFQHTWSSHLDALGRYLDARTSPGDRPATKPKKRAKP